MVNEQDNVAILSNYKPKVTLNKDNLADSIMHDLLTDGVIEPFEFDNDVELPLLSGMEKPLGSMLESEKHVFCYAIYLDNVIEDILREQNAEVADKVSALMRDKSVSTNSISERLNDITLTTEVRETLSRLIQSATLLRALWGYSVKQRFKTWNPVGVRKNWIVVTYDPR